MESDKVRGILTTYDLFDDKSQTLDPETRKYTGPYPTVTGRWTGLYENLAGAINGTAELQVKPAQVRDVLRIIELARESHVKRATVPWS